MKRPSLATVKMLGEIAALMCLCLLLLSARHLVNDFRSVPAQVNEATAQMVKSVGHADDAVKSVASDLKTVANSLRTGLDSANAAIQQVKEHEGRLFASAAAPGGVLDNAKKVGANLAAISSSFTVTAESLNHRLYDSGEFADILKKAALHFDRLAGEAEITTRRERAHLDDLFGPCVDDPDLRQSPSGPDLRKPCWGRTMANIQGMTASGNAIVFDWAGYVHRSTHPSKASIVFGFVWSGAKVVITNLPRVIVP